MKKVFVAVLVAAGFGLSGQTIENLNLLNTSGLHGTPRFTSMGGAFTALGNDFSSIHLNPAGASVFRKDRIGLSLGFQGQTDRTSFLNNSNENSSFNLLFENVGLVKKFGNQIPFTFGISYSKLADFNSDFRISGTNRFQDLGDSQFDFTLGDYWMAGAQDFTIEELEGMGFFEEASAASANLLPVDSLGPYLPYSPTDASNVEYVYEQSGNLSEALFSLGSQVDDRFYFGLAVGIPNLSYRQSSAVNENGFTDDSYIRSYTLNRSNEVYGNGINIKAGVIGKPVQWLRLGLSYQSPTWYTISEIYSLSVDAHTDNETFRGTEYIFDDIRYSVRTPAIWRTGVAMVLAQQAVISLDYEYTNPSSLNLSSRDGSNYESFQADFVNVTSPSNTLKTGLEYRIGPTYLRGGYRLRESNFTEPSDYFSHRTSYSVGFGYSNAEFNIDLGYTWTEYTNNYVVHPFLGDRLDGNGVTDRERTLVNNDITKGNVVIGVGFKF